MGKIKLTSEWSRMAPSVYQNIHGDRIHVMGVVGIYNQSTGKLKKYNTSTYDIFRFCSVIGGSDLKNNNRRGLMLMAELIRNPEKLDFLKFEIRGDRIVWLN